MSERICIGSVGPAHGVTGHFYISGRKGPLGFTPNFVSLDQEISREVAELKELGVKTILKLKGLEDRALVEALRGRALYTEQEDATSPEIVEDERAQIVGRVRRVTFNGAHENLEIEAADGRLVILPNVSDWFRRYPDRFVLRKPLVDIEEFWFAP